MKKQLYVYAKKNEGEFYVQEGFCGTENQENLIAQDVFWDGLRDVALANVPQMRLVKAYFKVKTVTGFRQVFGAFVAPFPSLKTIRTEIVWAIVKSTTEDELIAAVEVAKMEIINQENVKDFPGRISAHRRTFVSTWRYGSTVETEILIVPFVGDRYLKIISSGDEVEVTADYSVRPSLSAAVEIRKLTAVAEIYNSASVFVNGEKFPEDLPYPLGAEWAKEEYA